MITALESYTAVQANLEEAGVRIDRESSGLQLLPLALVEVGVGENFGGGGNLEFWNSGIGVGWWEDFFGVGLMLL